MEKLSKISDDYCEFPIEFLKSKDKMVFIHKHGNLDNVKTGRDLISRATCIEISKKSVMKVKTVRKLPLGHIFLGVVGQKSIANAYIVESTDTYAIIGSMSSWSL